MSRARRSQFEVRSYAGRDLYERVLREAAARRISVSECVRTDLTGYYAIQDELSGCVRVGDAYKAAPARRILHTLLAEMEERFVATIDRQTSAFSESLQVLAWMIDRGYLGSMLHFPDVPPADRDTRSKRAQDRLVAWRDAVRDSAVTGRHPVGVVLPSAVPHESSR